MDKIKFKAKDKRADIPVAILVLGVLALLIFGLLSFYMVRKSSKVGGIKSFSYLQELYNQGEYSYFTNENYQYPNREYVWAASDQGADGGGVFLVKSVEEPQGGVFGWGSNDKQVLLIQYRP
jgi:hypothetical protein